jgi:hypothetical protein
MQTVLAPREPYGGGGHLHFLSFSAQGFGGEKIKGACEYVHETLAGKNGQSLKVSEACSLYSLIA